MVPERKTSVDGRIKDRRTEWTEGRTEDAKTISIPLIRRGITKTNK